MKAVKILSMVLALLMVGMAFVACGGSKAPETTTEPENNVPHESLNVNIVVKDSLDGEVKYVSDDNTGYDFDYTTGDSATPLAILQEFMSSKYDIEITFDANGKLATVGDLAATNGHLWIWSLAKYPKDASMAEPMDENLDAYSDINKGDTIVIYLS